jgi:hypothetical protein
VVVIAWVLAMMAMVAPGRDHGRLGSAIAEVALSEPPLFAGDDDRRRTAALLVAVAFRESSLRADAIGDQGRARCAFQLWGAPAEALTDPALCTRMAVARLRESMRACGALNPLGTYAAGPGGCASERAARISRDRMWLAKRLAGVVL